MISNIEAIPAFSDNYIWILIKDNSAAVVDPGDASAVESFLSKNNLNLEAILITHHHFDHTGGIIDLASKRDIKVYGPKGGHINGIEYELSENSIITILETEFHIFETPGHTLDHIAYYSKEIDSLFCGDTLFSGGCGRLFEGTPLQMFDSLNKFSDLPEKTKVYCTHEYTLSNLTFALEVEPDNVDLKKYFEEVNSLRNSNMMSLPSSISLENKINPFLRTSVNQVKENAEIYANKKNLQPVEVLAAIRDWKDNF
jgi:hydroxyacylglutathione hydrolase